MQRTLALKGVFEAVATVATLGFFLLSSPASAEVFARIQVHPDAPTDDPHPITYFWDGSNQPVKDPVHFHTFFYTGRVESDATVEVGNRIGRVAVANNEWEQNKTAIINELTAYYVLSFGAQQVAAPQAGPQLAMDIDSGGFTQLNPVQQQGGQGAGVDPRAVAEWSFYLDQVVLWQFYCRRVIVNDRRAASANSSERVLQRRADRAALEGFEGDTDAVLDETERLREEEGELEGGGQPDANDNTPVVATVFEPEFIFDDPMIIDKYRNEFVELAEHREERAYNMFSGMLDGIRARETEFARYEDWLAGKQRELIEFARAWGKVQAGQRVTFDDTFYLITDEPLRSVPEDSRNVIRAEVLTPQDLIRSDGRLKGPQFPSSGLD